MADTVTDLYKFTKPQVGASANTWGNKWNVNLEGIDNVFQDLGGRGTGGSGSAYTYVPKHTGSPLFGEDGEIALKTGLSVRVKIHTPNTETTPTFKYGVLDAKPIKKNRGGNFVNLEIGELNDNSFAELLYHETVVSDGAWILLNPPNITDDTGHTNQLANHRALSVRYISDNEVQVKADAVVLRRGDGRKRLFQPSGGILENADITVSGANGKISPGAEAPGWYSIYLIGKDDGTIAAALSTENGAPGPAGGNWPPGISNLPSGYTYSGFVGVVRNNSSENFVQFWQTGNMVSILDTAPISVPHASAAYDDVGLGSYVPPEALVVRLGVRIESAAIPDFNIWEVRIAPSKATGTTARYSEIILEGDLAVPVRHQVDVGLTEMQKLYVRSPTFGDIGPFQLFVHGYYL